MKIICFGVWGLWMAAFLPAWAATEKVEGEAFVASVPLFLSVGEQRRLTISGLSRYSVGNAKVRATRLPSRREGEPAVLLLKGIAPGSTDLWIWKTDGQTEIRSLEIRRSDSSSWPPALIQALQHLSEASDLEILRTPEGALMRGTLNDRKSAAAVARALAAAPRGALRDETELSAPLLAEARAHIQRRLEETPVAGALALADTPGRVTLRGSTRSPAEREALARRLRAVFPLLDLEIECLPDTSPTVSFRVQLLEIQRSRALDVGLKWPLASNGLTLTRQGFSWLEWNLELKHQQSSGTLKILSSPELVVRAPGEAEVFSGGEFPIQLQTRFGPTILWKNFGLSLKLNVTQVAGSRVRFEITSETSHLDRTLAVGDVPGLQSNRLKTQVDATFGEPLLLTGLVRQDTQEGAAGIPLLSQVPVLGTFFGNQTAQDLRTELVSVVYPMLHPGRAPVERLHRLSPKGPLAPPRDWLSSEDEVELRESGEFPWNAPWREGETHE